MKFDTTRQFQVIIETNNKDAEKAKKDLIFALKSLDFRVVDIKNIRQTRTLMQNRSLHKLFAELSQECLEKGIDMRMIVRDEVSIECTPENLKWLWKKMQYSLFGTKSTTKLKRDKQIDIVYRNFASLISERTQGEIIVPPFPSKEALEEISITMKKVQV